MVKENDRYKSVWQNQGQTCYFACLNTMCKGADNVEDCQEDCQKTVQPTMLAQLGPYKKILNSDTLPMQ